jgi:hypothetical protein
MFCNLFLLLCPDSYLTKNKRLEPYLVTGSTQPFPQLLGSLPRHNHPLPSHSPIPPDRNVASRSAVAVSTQRVCLCACGSTLRQARRHSHGNLLHAGSPFVLPTSDLSLFCPFLHFPLKRFPAHIFPAKTQVSAVFSILPQAQSLP